MLNCMISAFCLAVMHMQVLPLPPPFSPSSESELPTIHSQGSRSSEEQLISTGMLLTVASMAFSFATPVEKLSTVRSVKSPLPLPVVRHPAVPGGIYLPY